MTDQVQITALFRGHVQGVGFRYTARSIARRFAVSGYVRNLPDGRVELVAEGARDELRGFIDAIREEMGGNIHDISTHEAPATGSFTGFEIRH